MSDSVTRLASLPPIRQVLDAHGLMAKKSLGQHFLCDLNITRKIARFARLPAEATVLEIGPGPGALTRALLESPLARLVAIEKDARFLPALEGIRALSDNRLTILHDDALRADMAALCTDGDRTTTGMHIVANLPYNISTPLLVGWMHAATHIDTMTLMLQKEVADRIAATPSTKQYGRLSVLVQMFFIPTDSFDVPASVFVPPPNVTSSVLHLRRRTPLPEVAIATLETLTAAAFGQRRKMLRQSLKRYGGEDFLHRAGLDPTRRAETLTREEFITLCNILQLEN